MSDLLVFLVSALSASTTIQQDVAIDYEKLGASVVEEYCKSGQVTLVDVHDRTLFFFDDVGDFLRKWIERDQAAKSSPIGCTVTAARHAPASYRNPFQLDERLRSGDFEVIQVTTDRGGRKVPWLVFLRGRQLLRLSYIIDPE